MERPLLCSLGIHKPYRYLPRVGDFSDSIACRRCGFGKRLSGEWDIPPSHVQESVAKEAQIEYGRVLGFFRTREPLYAMQTAYDVIKDRFTEDELKPITDQLEKMYQMNEKVKGGSL